MATTAEPANTMQPADKEEVATSAKDRTFGITEIHEAILIKLDMKTLLFAQRVTRDWQKLIDTSPSLQKKLFMQPATAAETIGLGITHGNLNTFLSDDSFAALNPLLVDSERRTMADVPATYTLSFPGNPIWKKMLLSQPPTPTINVSWYLNPYWDDYIANYTPKFRIEGVGRESLGSYEPVEEEWKESLEVTFYVHHVRGLLCHDSLTELKDSPPQKRETFPGNNLWFWDED